MERCQLLLQLKVSELDLNTVEKHIFKDCDDFFEIKHNIFLDDYLGDCILIADSVNGASMQEINFSFDGDGNDKVFYAKVLNDLYHSNPIIDISFTSFLNSNIYYKIFYLNNYQEVEDFYCLYQVYDFEVEGMMLHQVYEVKIKSLDMINDFWITHDVDIDYWNE